MYIVEAGMTHGTIVSVLGPVRLVLSVRQIMLLTFRYSSRRYDIRSQIM